MSKFQEKLKIQRQNEETARAGLKWSPEEETAILDSLSSGKTMADVALKLQRTEGSIRTRLFTIICKRIDNGDALEAYYCNEYSVSSDDIASFRQVRKEREEKMQNRMQNKTKSEFTGDVSQRSMAGDLKFLKREIDNIKRHVGMR
jgi:hypothetical protein